MIKKFNLLFLTFFMVGKIKYAPGTFASLFTCALFFLIVNVLNYSVLFLITLVIFFYSFVAINNSFNEFKSEDPQEIVIDEVVGQILVLLGSTALNALIGNDTVISKARGQWVQKEIGKANPWIIASFHPAFLMRQPEQKKLAWIDLKMIREKSKILNI